MTTLLDKLMGRKKKKEKKTGGLDSKQFEHGNRSEAQEIFKKTIGGGKHYWKPGMGQDNDWNRILDQVKNTRKTGYSKKNEFYHE